MKVYKHQMLRARSHKPLQQVVFLLSILMVSFCSSHVVAKAPIPITLWHSMAGNLNTHLNHLAHAFNQSQDEYVLVPKYKGYYPDLLTSTIAAFRASRAPDIVQVYDVGTATMLHPIGAILPIYKLPGLTGITLNTYDIFKPIKAYYANKDKQLLALPFNASIPLLYYNMDAFKKAGLDSTHAPKTWEELERISEHFKDKGYECGFTTTWPGWIQIEALSFIHKRPIATDNNGLDSLKARLRVDNPLTRHHLTKLRDWSKKGIFKYAGRSDSAQELFTSGICPMLFQSSGSLTGLMDITSFNMGVGAMPYWDEYKPDVPGTIIGGAALWVISGKDTKTYKGVALYFKFLLTKENQYYWYSKTGYLPISHGAYRYGKDKGYYDSAPQSELGVLNIMQNESDMKNLAIRLGFYPQVRDIIENEIEAVLANKKSAKAAMHHAVLRGNKLLERFFKNVT